VAEKVFMAALRVLRIGASSGSPSVGQAKMKYPLKSVS
jgi:hypothetical protein